jgi:hypothetical protein
MTVGLAPQTNVRLLDLGQKRMTMKAKSELLTELKTLGYLPDNFRTSAQTMKREKEAVSTTMTPFGPLLIERDFKVNGVIERFPVQNPLAMLYTALLESDRYAQYMRDAIALHGEPSHDNPYSLVLYFDEVTCGNPLALGHKRKVQAVYWSIYQLGMVALSDEMCWFEIIAFQNREVLEFDGFMSQVVDVALTCFFDRSSHDLRDGLVFNLRGHGMLLLVAEVELLIADIKALCEVISSNGVSAVLPCMLCDRVVSYKAKSGYPVLRDDDSFVTLSCLEPRKWGKRSSVNILEVLQKLDDTHTAHGDGTLLKRQQTLNGYKYCVCNVFLNSDLRLRPTDIIVFDWMHVFFQTGCWNREVWAVFRMAKAAHLPSYFECAVYVHAWMIPCSLDTLFNTDHYNSCNKKDAAYFKCQASQGLSIYAVIGKFFAEVLLPRARLAGVDALERAVFSYLKLCDVIDLLTLSKGGIYISPATLDRKSAEWGDALLASHGESLFYPKTHKAIAHLADQLQKRDRKGNATGYLPACWAQESCNYNALFDKTDNAYKSSGIHACGYLKFIIVNTMHYNCMNGTSS